MMQLIFFAVSVLVLLLGHFFLWQFFVIFLNVSSLTGRTYVALLILFLFLSVILASYLIHKSDNLFTRWYYIVSSFWIGLLVNLFLSAFLVIFLKFVIPLLHINISNLVYQILFFELLVSKLQFRYLCNLLQCQSSG